jgi:hypothetical protein
VTYPSLTLYSHLGSFYDVTAGGNGACGGEGAAQCGNPNVGFSADCDYTSTGTPATGDAACDATPGFDGPSGLGTPTGLGDFMPNHVRVGINGNGAVNPHETYEWSIPTGDPFPGGRVIRYVINWGDGAPSTVSSGPVVAHAYATAGHRTMTVQVSDTYGQTGTASKAISVS